MTLLHLNSLRDEHRPDSHDDDVIIERTSYLDSDRIRFWLGLVLAVSSTIFIGSSFIIKKFALQKLNSSGQTRAGAGGFGYLKQWLWWAGFLTLGLGEAFNFAAYSLVAASLVTPLGALSVVVSALLAAKYLDEKLNLIGRLGCTLCVLGSTVLVIHAPVESQVDDLERLGSMLLEYEFLIYLTFVILTTFFLIAVCAPKYGNTNVLVYVLICSLIGSLSVMACKGLGLGIRETISGRQNQLTSSTFWFFLLSVIVTVSIQMNYLNKALDVFETSLVTPIHYVFFTTFVLIASSILFKEWNSIYYQDMVAIVCGFLILIIAIFLLNAFSDFDITFEILRKHWIRQKAQKSVLLSRSRLMMHEDVEEARNILVPLATYQSSLTSSGSGVKVAPGKKLKKTRKTKRATSQQSSQAMRNPLPDSDSESDI